MAKNDDTFPTAAACREETDNALSKVMVDVIRDVKLRIDQCKRSGYYKLTYTHQNEYAIKKLTDFLKHPERGFFVTPNPGDPSKSITISW